MEQRYREQHITVGGGGGGGEGRKRRSAGKKANVLERYAGFIGSKIAPLLKPISKSNYFFFLARLLFLHFRKISRPKSHEVIFFALLPLQKLVIRTRDAIILKFKADIIKNRSRRYNSILAE